VSEARSLLVQQNVNSLPLPFLSAGVLWNGRTNAKEVIWKFIARSGGASQNPCWMLIHTVASKAY
jgi:hypothetical protein